MRIDELGNILTTKAVSYLILRFSKLKVDFRSEAVAVAIEQYLPY